MNGLFYSFYFVFLSIKSIKFSSHTFFILNTPQKSKITLLFLNGRQFFEFLVCSEDMLS